MHSLREQWSQNDARNAILTPDMKKEITIRPATFEDTQALIDNNQAMAWETETRRLDEEVLRLGVSNLIKDPNKGFYLLAEIHGTVAGSLMVTSEWSDWRNAEMWWFQSVYVLPEYRGYGVFKALFHRVTEMAKAKGVPELRLYVERENQRAQKVYRALGMKHSHYDMWEMEI
jgi:GNAT superfamily N-acetyltransferase